MNFQGIGVILALGLFVKAMIEFAISGFWFLITIILKIFRQ